MNGFSLGLCVLILQLLFRLSYGNTRNIAENQDLWKMYQDKEATPEELNGQYLEKLNLNTPLNDEYKEQSSLNLELDKMREELDETLKNMENPIPIGKEKSLHYNSEKKNYPFQFSEPKQCFPEQNSKENSFPSEISDKMESLSRENVDKINFPTEIYNRKDCLQGQNPEKKYFPFEGSKKEYLPSQNIDKTILKSEIPENEDYFEGEVSGKKLSFENPEAKTLLTFPNLEKHNSSLKASEKIEYLQGYSSGKKNSLSAVEEIRQYDPRDDSHKNEKDSAKEQPAERLLLSKNLYRPFSKKELYESVGQPHYMDDTFVGTNLFGEYRKECFSAEDVILLTIRKDLETLVPKTEPVHFMDDKEVGQLIKYFCMINGVIQNSVTNSLRRLAKMALYDTMGGYLQYSLLPMIKLSYYAGKVNRTTVDSTIKLYEQCKVFLNTNGNGWRHSKPFVEKLLESSNITPLIIPNELNDSSSCADLFLSTSEFRNDPQDSRLIISLPKLNVDENGLLESIKLPFKRKQIHNIKSPSSESIFAKFYKDVIACYKFQHIPYDLYNHKIKEWITENVYIHLQDEEFYPGLASVLQIMKTLNKITMNVTTKSPTTQDDQLLEDEIKAYKSENLAENIDLKTKKIKKSNKILDFFRFNKKDTIKTSMESRVNDQLHDSVGNYVNSRDISDEEYESIRSKYYHPELYLSNIDKYKFKYEPVKHGFFNFGNEPIHYGLAYGVIGSGFLIVVGGLGFLVYRQYFAKYSKSTKNPPPPPPTLPTPSKRKHNASKLTRYGKRNGGLDLKESTSTILCQPGRKCIPIPYTNIGSRIARNDLTYYTSTDTDGEVPLEPSKSKKKKSGGSYDDNSWTTTYIFHK